MAVDTPCVICGGPVDGRQGLVLVRGRQQQAHCSETCLRASLRRHALARAASRRRALRGLSALSLLAALWLVVAGVWRRHRRPPSRSISYAWPDVHGGETAPKPFVFGPPWPPTDEQWTALFDGAAWTHPLPGPDRRVPARDPRVFGPEPPRDRPAICRKAWHCGVDLGGELWGEHVYAALDGVVERVQGDGNERRGGHYVRLSHFGGTMFTQYFHLAATPRKLTRGTHVSAGEVIGLLGDTGLDGARRHLYFSLSVRPSNDLPEVYWDPTPWLARATLRLPPHGTVAGYAPPEPRLSAH